MKKEFELDIRETFDGDLMIKELREHELSIPFNQSASITVVVRKTTADESVVRAYVHNHSNKDVINRFPIEKDGRYIVIHAVVPNDKWLDAATEDGSISKYSRVIVCIDGILAEYIDGSLEPIHVTDLKDVDEQSNIQVEVKETFVLYNLWQCYLNYCKNLFEGECSKDSSCSDCNDEMTYNRHLLWIFLNNIQYLMKLGRPEDAQKLLEDISGCNSLCSNEMFSKQYDCGCG